MITSTPFTEGEWTNASVQVNWNPPNSTASFLWCGQYLCICNCAQGASCQKNSVDCGVLVCKVCYSLYVLLTHNKSAFVHIIRHYSMLTS